MMKVQKLNMIVLMMIINDWAMIHGRKSCFLFKRDPMMSRIENEKWAVEKIRIVESTRLLFSDRVPRLDITWLEI